MSDITIVIPHRGNPLGLWATLHSCEEDLQGSKYNYNYVVVTNGEKLTNEEESTLAHIERKGKLLKHIHSTEPLSPPLARTKGVEAADGDIICFFDNHCLVSKQYFDRVMLNFKRDDIDLLHSSTIFHTGDGTHYHYNLTLDYNFWGRGCLLPQNEYKPYMIAMAGHGGFCIKKSTWEEIGGYGPTSLLSGYGGEESLLDLKLWRLGKKNWIDPKLIHYHYPGKRVYSRHFTDEYYINLLTAAHVIGGESWLYKVFDSILTKNHIRPYTPDSKSNMDLLETAFYRGHNYSKELDFKSIRSLDECLQYFVPNEIAM